MKPENTKQIDWGKVNIKELKCPKCGVVGRLNRNGHKWSGNHKLAMFRCLDCGKQFSELVIKDQAPGEELIEPIDITALPPTTAAKVNRLIELCREHTDWGNIRLNKQLKKELGSGLTKTLVVKVKNLVRGGWYGLQA